jgi:hypothetical protein
MKHHPPFKSRTDMRQFPVARPLAEIDEDQCAMRSPMGIRMRRRAALRWPAMNGNNLASHERANHVVIGLKIYLAIFAFCSIFGTVSTRFNLNASLNQNDQMVL